jgi:outer membrane protein OmpA-like peptidoglycan-associated protein
MKTYLLYAFQPYGALIMVGQAVGKQVGKINLDPVQFEPGEDKLTSAHKDYLKKLGKVMQDRPKIDVQICAYTTIADVSLRKEDAQEKAPGELSQRQIDKSVKLGQVRQKVIKDYLISEFKVSDGRLILCAPEYDDSKDAKPRVELLI